MEERPDGVVTITSTAAVPAGEVAVIDVSELTVTSVAGVLPNSTVVCSLEAVKPVPAMITGVPPATGPTAGLRAVTVGA